MKEYKVYREVIKGTSLEDYCQWKAKKEKELGEKEEYTLRNMQKYFEYQKRSIEKGDIFDVFQNSYFYVIVMAFTLITTVVITFCSNILNGMLGINTNTDDIEKIKKIIELYQDANLNIMSIILNCIIVSVIVLLGIVVGLLVIKDKFKKNSVFKQMYCQEMTELIEAAMKNNK